MKLDFTDEHVKLGTSGVKVTGYNKDVYIVKRPLPSSYDLHLPDGRMLCFTGLGTLKERLAGFIKNGAY